MTFKIRLKQEMEQDRAQLAEMKKKVAGLWDVVAKKNVQLSQSKINEERSDLELKKWKKLENEFKLGSNRFVRVKKDLEKLFLSEESFCGELGSRDDFANLGDDEICATVEFIFKDYVAAKKAHFNDLHHFNGTIRKMKSQLIQKDQRLNDVASKFNTKIEEVQSRMSDVKLLSAKLEMANVEKLKLERKFQSFKEAVEREHRKYNDLNSGTKDLIRDLKSGLEQASMLLNFCHFVTDFL